MDKFKAGDKVRIIGKDSDHDFKLGYIGVIATPLSVERVQLKSTGDDAPGYRVNGGDDYWWVHESDMEIVEEA